MNSRVGVDSRKVDFNNEKCTMQSWDFFGLWEPSWGVPGFFEVDLIFKPP